MLDTQALASSRFERAYRSLRQAITEGEYRPNQRLIETELAARLNVSRPTVRSILVRLEEEGLVVIEPNRGASVRSFDVEEALRILRLREVLEGLTASLTAEHGSPEQLAEIATVVEEMARMVEADDLITYSALNTTFHRLICQAAGDQRVQKLLMSLNHALIRFQYRTILVSGRKQQSLGEHQRILERLLDHDPDGAEQAMRYHVAQVRATMQHSAALLA